VSSFHLVTAASKRAALHRAGVVISGVVELDMAGGGVHTVDYRWKTTAQSQ